MSLADLPAAPPAFDSPAAVHLTFDDGPGHQTEAVLDVLAAHGAKATFYLVGEQVRKHPETVRRIVAEGHRVANHSTTHPNLTELAPDQVAAEIGGTQRAVADVTGTRVVAFRPPFGAVDDAVRAAASDAGVSVDLWDVDSEDWKDPGAQAVLDRVLAGAAPGAVILLHVLFEGTVTALPRILAALRERGLATD